MTYKRKVFSYHFPDQFETYFKENKLTEFKIVSVQPFRDHFLIFLEKEVPEVIVDKFPKLSTCG